MENQWKYITFSLTIDKEIGTYKIKDSEELLQLIEDHSVKTQGIRASPQVKPFLAMVLEWEKKLASISDIIEEIIKCQKSWLYLEPIFVSKDIITQLPNESLYFQTQDQEWKNIMSDLYENSNVLVFCNVEKQFERFVQMNEKFDTIFAGSNTNTFEFSYKSLIIFFHSWSCV
jgi:dynein heavy chain